jgi:hypothetical protein
VPEIREGLCRLFAFVERHVRDALEQVGVVLEGADMGPCHLVRRIAEVVVAKRLESSKPEDERAAAKQIIRSNEDVLAAFVSRKAEVDTMRSGSRPCPRSSVTAR